MRIESFAEPEISSCGKAGTLSAHLKKIFHHFALSDLFLIIFVATFPIKPFPSPSPPDSNDSSNYKLHLAVRFGRKAGLADNVNETGRSQLESSP